jgi:hypothetical protein
MIRVCVLALVGAAALFAQDANRQTPKRDFGDRAMKAGDPVGGVDVGLKKRPAGQLIVARTDKDGKFRVDGLPAGTYELTVSIPANNTAKSFFESRSNMRFAVKIEGTKTGTLEKVIVRGWDPATKKVIRARPGEIDTVTIEVARGQAITGVVSMAPEKPDTNTPND